MFEQDDDDAAAARARARARRRKEQEEAARKRPPVRMPENPAPVRPDVARVTPRADATLESVLGQGDYVRTREGQTVILPQGRNVPRYEDLNPDDRPRAVGQLAVLPAIRATGGDTDFIERGLRAAQRTPEQAQAEAIEGGTADIGDLDAARRRTLTQLRVARESGDAISAELAEQQLKALTRTANLAEAIEGDPRKTLTSRFLGSFFIADPWKDERQELTRLREYNPVIEGEEGRSYNERPYGLDEFAIQTLGEVAGVATGVTALSALRRGIGAARTGAAASSALASNLDRARRVASLEGLTAAERAAMARVAPVREALATGAEMTGSRAASMAGTRARRGAQEGLVQGVAADVREAEAYGGDIPLTAGLSLALGSAAGAAFEVAGGAVYDKVMTGRFADRAVRESVTDRLLRSVEGASAPATAEAKEFGADLGRAAARDTKLSEVGRVLSDARDARMNALEQEEPSLTARLVRDFNAQKLASAESSARRVVDVPEAGPTPVRELAEGFRERMRRVATAMRDDPRARGAAVGGAGAGAAAAADEEDRGAALAGTGIVAVAGARGSGRVGPFTTRMTRGIEALPKAWDEPRPVSDWMAKVRSLPNVSRQEAEDILVPWLESKAQPPKGMVLQPGEKAAPSKAKVTREEVMEFLRSNGYQARVRHDVKRSDPNAIRDTFDEQAYEAAYERKSELESSVSSLEERHDAAEEDWLGIMREKLSETLPGRDDTGLYDTVIDDLLDRARNNFSDSGTGASRDDITGAIESWAEELRLRVADGEEDLPVSADEVEDLIDAVTRTYADEGVQSRAQRFAREYERMHDARTELEEFSVDDYADSALDEYRRNYEPDDDADPEYGTEYSTHQRLDKSATYRESLAYIEKFGTSGGHYDDSEDLVAWSRTEDHSARMPEGGNGRGRIAFETQSDYAQGGSMSGFKRRVPPEKVAERVAHAEQYKEQAESLRNAADNMDEERQRLNAERGRPRLAAQHAFDEMRRSIREAMDEVSLESDPDDLVGAPSGNFAGTKHSLIMPVLREYIADRFKELTPSEADKAAVSASRYVNDRLSRADDPDLFSENWLNGGSISLPGQTLGEIPEQASLVRAMDRNSSRHLSGLVTRDIAQSVFSSVEGSRGWEGVNKLFPDGDPENRVRATFDDALALAERIDEGTSQIVKRLSEGGKFEGLTRKARIGEASYRRGFEEMRRIEHATARARAEASRLDEKVDSAGSEWENPNSPYPFSAFAGTSDAAMLSVAMELDDAITDNLDWIAFGNPADRQARASLGEAASIAQYGQAVPKAINRVLQSIGVKNVEWFDVPHPDGDSIKFKALRLTPELRDAARKVGIPILGALFAMSVGAETAEAQGPAEPASPKDDTSKLILGGVAAAALTSLGIDVMRKGTTRLLRELRANASGPAAVAGAAVALDLASDNEGAEAISDATLAAAMLKAVGSKRMSGQAKGLAKVIADKLGTTRRGRRLTENINPVMFLDPRVQKALTDAEKVTWKGRAKATRWGEELSRDPKMGRAVTEVMREMSVKGYVSETLPNLSADEMNAAIAMAERLAQDIEDMTDLRITTGNLTPEAAEASGGRYYLPFMYAQKEAEAATRAGFTFTGKGSSGLRQRREKMRTLDSDVRAAEAELQRIDTETAATSDNTRRRALDRERMEVQDALDLAIVERNDAREALGEIRDGAYLASAALEGGYAQAAAAQVQKMLWSVDGAVLPDFKSLSEDFKLAKEMYDQALDAPTRSTLRADIETARFREDAAKRRITDITAGRYMTKPDGSRVSQKLLDTATAEYTVAREARLDMEKKLAAAGSFDDRRTAEQMMAQAKERMDALANKYRDTDGEYVSLPNTKAYGPLAGAVVSRPIFLALNGLPDLAKPDPLVSAWKQVKTVFNPGTHVGNIMGNVWMAHMSANIPLWRQPKLLLASSSAIKTYDPDVQLLAESGVLGLNAVAAGLDDATRRASGVGEKELLRLRRRTEPKMAQRLKDAGILTLGEQVGGKAGSLIDKLSAGARSDVVGWEKFKSQARALYENEDNVFRVMAYKHAVAPSRDGGLDMSPKAGVEYARRTMVDFRTKSPLLMRLSRGRVGLPFILYPAKALPVAMSSLIDHPERYATLAAAWVTLDHVAEKMHGGDINEERDVPDGLRSTFSGPLALMFPEMVQVPLPPNERGAKPAMDMTRWTPLSAATSGSPPGSFVGDAGLPAVFQIGGPYLDIISRLANARDPRTGRSMVRYEDSKGENIMRFAGEASKAFMPPVVSYRMPEFIDATKRGDSQGQAMALAGMAGMRPRYYAPGERIVRERAAYDRAEMAINQDMNRNLRLGGDSTYVEEQALEAARRRVKAKNRMVDVLQRTRQP